MKKFISFALAATMVMSLVPATAFAASDASISNSVTVEEDSKLGTGSDAVKSAPILTLKAVSDFKKVEDQTLRLELKNAEWTDEFGAGSIKLYDDNGAPVILAGDTTGLEKTLNDAKAARDKAIADFKLVYDDYCEVPFTGTDVAAVSLTEADYVTVATPGKILLKATKTAAAAVAAFTVPQATVATEVGNVATAQNAYDTQADKGAFVVKTSGDTKASITINEALAKLIQKDWELRIDLNTKVTGGIATVEVNGLESEFTSETKTFAKTSDGATKAYVDSKKSFQDGGDIDPIFIEEIVAKTIETGDVKLKLNGGFEWAEGATAEVFEGDGTVTKLVGFSGSDKSTLVVNVTKQFSKAALIKVSGLKINEDGASFGDVAKVTVSGANTSKETIEVGTYVDFGVTLTAAKKDLPVIYAGSQAKDGSDNSENVLLKATIEESVAASWIDNRKMTLTLPEGVEFVGVDKVTATNFLSKSSAEDGVKAAIDPKDEDNVINFIGKTTFEAAPDDKTFKKRKLEIEFTVSAKADFTGDIEMKLSGPAVANEELKVVLGTVKAPIIIKSDVNELQIDHRQTAVKDFTITEPAAGVWEKDDKIIIEAEDMDFEDDLVAKVTKGDMKIKDIDVNDGTIEITVDSMSSKDAAEITFSKVALNMNRSLPAGDYKLTVKGYAGKTTTKTAVVPVYKIAGDDTSGISSWKVEEVNTSTGGNKMFMNNYIKGDKATGFFDTEKITLMKDFVKVTTAGREDATFTTKIVVPVGANKIMAGTKEITIDAPAYINKDGYTMLPVRAVIEALNGMAAVRWDDSTKTATITFGTRLISMSVNSKVMNINGVPTALLAAPEIKSSRVFLPLRDLGYALGLKDDKIAWDSATSTATLN